MEPEPHRTPPQALAVSFFLNTEHPLMSILGFLFDPMFQRVKCIQVVGVESGKSQWSSDSNLPSGQLLAARESYSLQP